MKYFMIAYILYAWTGWQSLPISEWKTLEDCQIAMNEHVSDLEFHKMNNADMGIRNWRFTCSSIMTPEYMKEHNIGIIPKINDLGIPE